jgi:hypothetical protein
MTVEQIHIGRFGRTKADILVEMESRGGKDRFLRFLILKARDQMGTNDLFGLWATLNTMGFLTEEHVEPSTTP